MKASRFHLPTEQWKTAENTILFIFPHVKAFVRKKWQGCWKGVEFIPPFVKNEHDAIDPSQKNKEKEFHRNAEVVKWDSWMWKLWAFLIDSKMTGVDNTLHVMIMSCSMHPLRMLWEWIWHADSAVIVISSVGLSQYISWCWWCHHMEFWTSNVQDILNLCL